MTIHDANSRLLFQLYHVYNNSEAANIADMVMEHITGWKRIDRITNKQVKLSETATTILEKYTAELLMHKPVQYVLQEAWFYGLKFYVDENVLIPRQETEELVEWILNSYTDREQQWSLLDIGTGSGCIPVAIKKARGNFFVQGCDVSEKALDVAKKNADRNNVAADFIRADVLDEQEWKKLTPADVLVSNPPYIPASEASAMDENVTRYEPHLALFVNQDDPLLFYRKIAGIGKVKLKRGGRIFVEVHEEFARQTAALFTKNGYQEVEIRKDMQGKERFVAATGR